MKKPIDNFSRQSGLYAKFRPVYPQALYEAILRHVPQRHCAWDCGTGNGQVALVLASHFEKVYATDLSQKQIDQAPHKSNIDYRVARCEASGLPDRVADLVTVGQALHWFDFDAFYAEVNRVGKAGGLLAVWGYDMPRFSAEIDPIADHFYETVAGPFWDPERRLVETHYRTIPFPFDEIPVSGRFFINDTWTLDQYEGYVNTWSSVQKYIAANGNNPVDALIDEIRTRGLWQQPMPARFPVFVRLGLIA
jgi:ubiquinone/menaquinone biosynthesis C-methylase UbiE